jgi:hypothetical protein
MFRRSLIAAASFLVCFSLAAPLLATELVINGGFETGTFSGWDLSGSTDYMSVSSVYGDAKTGTYGAKLGPMAAHGFLSQSQAMATNPGDIYQISWWLRNGASGTNDFNVTWGGSTLLSASNMAQQPYTSYADSRLASGTSTALTFAVRNDPNFFYLDDVSVTLAGHQQLSASSDATKVLVGTSGAARISVSNTGDAGTLLTGSFGTASGTFNGVGAAFSVPNGGEAHQDYSYAPVVRGSASQAVHVTSFGGNADVTLSGQGVAPQNQVTSSPDAIPTRIGTSKLILPVSNIGDGNLAGLGDPTNLHGTASLSGSSRFTLTTPTINLTDGASTNLISYTPLAHTVDSTTAEIRFSNGSQDGKNLSETLQSYVSGQGVGPVFASTLNGTPLAPGSLIDFGQVAIGDTAEKLLGIGNITTDPGEVALTGLTLLRAVLGGPDAGMFSLEDFTPGTVIDKGFWDDFELEFSATGGPVARNATLTIYTDEGAAFGSSGHSFLFNLQASALAVPEPASLLTWSGLGVIGAVMAYRRKRRAA